MEIPAVIMDTCNKTVFNEVPGIIECEGSVAEVDIHDLDAPVLHNNQQDEFLMEFNPEKVEHWFYAETINTNRFSSLRAFRKV